MVKGIRERIIIEGWRWKAYKHEIRKGSFWSDKND